PVRHAYSSREACSRSEALGGADEPAAVPPVAGGCWVPILSRSVRTLSHSIGNCRLLKLETLLLDIDPPPLNRELFFSQDVLPSALVSCLQIGIVEGLSAGTIEVLEVAVDHPDLLGKTGHRNGQGSHNQSSSQHTQDSICS